MHRHKQSLKDTFSCPDSGHNAVQHKEIGPHCELELKFTMWSATLSRPQSMRISHFFPFFRIGPALAHTHIHIRKSSWPRQDPEPTLSQLTRFAPWNRVSRVYCAFTKRQSRNFFAISKSSGAGSIRFSTQKKWADLTQLYFQEKNRVEPALFDFWIKKRGWAGSTWFCFSKIKKSSRDLRRCCSCFGHSPSAAVYTVCFFNF